MSTVDCIMELFCRTEDAMGSTNLTISGLGVAPLVTAFVYPQHHLLTCELDHTARLSTFCLMGWQGVGWLSGAFL
jgi:hypothetical protein